MSLLNWEEKLAYSEASLGTDDDGVKFRMIIYPHCYRRGPFCLLIEVCGGVNRHKWGCFDGADQPMRYFHKKENLLSEAEAIAQVLWDDRQRCT